MAKRDATSKGLSGKSVEDAIVAAEVSVIAAMGDEPAAKPAAKPKANSKAKTVDKPPKSATAKAATAKLVTITDIGDHLAATFDIPKSHAKIYLVEAVALIGKQLKKGAKVRLSGLGTLQVKKRAARKARNPNTGEEVKVKAGKRVVFAASTDLKAKL